MERWPTELATTMGVAFALMAFWLGHVVGWDAFFYGALAIPPIWYATSLALTLRRGRLLALGPDDLAFGGALVADEHPVEIAIFEGSRAIGADRGVIVLQEGLLAFTGRATSFSLSAQDVVLDSVFAGASPYRRLPKDALRLRIPGRDLYVRIMALDGEARFLSGEVSAFLHRSATSVEPRQWPPLASYGEGAVPEPHALPDASKPTP